MLLLALMEEGKTNQKSSLSAYVEKPADVRFADQERGEEVLLMLRAHPITNVPWILILLLILLAPLVLPQILEGTGLDPTVLPERTQILLLFSWYLFSLGYGILSFLYWYFNIDLITNRRVVDLDYYGFLFYRLSEAPLSQIQDVTYQVGGLFGIVFNFGDLYIQTAAEQREFDFLKIPNPAKVHDLLTDLIEE